MCNVPACWGFPAFQQPAAGPPPAVPSHIADGWCGLTVLRPAHPPGHPPTARAPHPCQARTRVHQSLATCSLSHRLSQAQPLPLRAPPRCRAFKSISSVAHRVLLPSSSAALIAFAAAPPFAACQRPPARASRWRGAQCLPALARRVPGRANHSRHGHQRGSRVTGGRRTQAGGTAEKWLYFSYTSIA